MWGLSEEKSEPIKTLLCVAGLYSFLMAFVITAEKNQKRQLNQNWDLSQRVLTTLSEPFKYEKSNHFLNYLELIAYDAELSRWHDVQLVPSDDVREIKVSLCSTIDNREFPLGLVSPKELSDYLRISENYIHDY